MRPAGTLTPAQPGPITREARPAPRRAAASAGSAPADRPTPAASTNSRCTAATLPRQNANRSRNRSVTTKKWPLGR